MSDKFQVIDESGLVERLTEAKPDNVDPDDGYALINVLSADAYAKEHIPQSINIPLEEIEGAKDRFSEEKEIIVYCASPTCDASPKAAEALAEMGFKHVKDYSGGLSDWKKAGHESVSAAV